MSVSVKLMLPLSFVTLALSLFLLGVLTNVYLQDVIKIRDFDDKIENLHLLSHELFLTDQNFFTFAAVSPAFYQSGTSAEQQRHDALLTQITAERREIADLVQRTPLARQQQTVDSLFAKYKTSLDQAFQVIRTRGFKDYGLEGSMRYHAHWLEDSSDNKASILMLRRHEKDYFLRNDIAYVDLFNQRCAQLAQSYEPDRTARYHLEQYQAAFNRIVDLEREIGSSSQKGLQVLILTLADQINSELTLLSAASHQEVAAMMQTNKRRFFWLIGASLAVVFGIGYFICGQLVTPLSRLTQTIDQHITNDYRRYSPAALNSSVKEIKTLGNSFDALMGQLQTLLEEAEATNSTLEDRNQALAKTNRELDLLVYSASHDLRAPLTSLEGLVTLSRHEDDPAERDHYHELMLGRIKHLNGFIQDIVDYARNNRQVVKREEIALNALAEQVLLNYEFLEQYATIDKPIEIEQHVPFYSDPTRLTVIIKNLCSNAIRYYDPNKAEPFVRISGTVTPEALQLTVADNGLGIPADQQDKIFNMFYRASDQARGSGLGLFIVREMVNRLRGEILVNSVAGEGTVFILRLPNLAGEALDSAVPTSRPLVAH